MIETDNQIMALYKVIEGCIRHKNCFTFMSSTNEGNPPIDMNVTKPKTNDAHEPLAWNENTDELQ